MIAASATIAEADIRGPKFSDTDPWELFCGQTTLTGQIATVHAWRNFGDEAQPDAVLRGFDRVQSPAEAMMVARAFERGLGLIAICRERTYCEREPRTLMDELLHENWRHFTQDCGWEKTTYDLIREAFELVGFKRSVECTAKALVDAYLLDGDDFVKRYPGQHQWILNFQAWQTMVVTLPVCLGVLLRAHRMRHRTRQHFSNLDKVEYDYAEMKQSRAALHAEFTSTYRIFRRLVAIRFATPVAIAVPVPVQQPNGWIKTHQY